MRQTKGMKGVRWLILEHLAFPMSPCVVLNTTSQIPTASKNTIENLGSDGYSVSVSSVINSPSAISQMFGLKHSFSGLSNINGPQSCASLCSSPRSPISCVQFLVPFPHSTGSLGAQCRFQGHEISQNLSRAAAADPTPLRDLGKGAPCWAVAALLDHSWPSESASDGRKRCLSSWRTKPHVWAQAGRISDPFCVHKLHRWLCG